MTTATLTLVSTDMAEITLNPELITVTVILDSYPSVTPVIATFTVEILDPCLSTVLAFDPAIVNMEITVNAGAVTQDITATDTMIDVTLCGPLSYYISPTINSFLNLTSDILTL